MTKFEVFLRTYLSNQSFDKLSRLKNLPKRLVEKFYIKNQFERHKIKLKEIKTKDKVKVAFFAKYASMWKYENLYSFFQSDKRFELNIFIVPIITQNKDYMISEMEKTYQYFCQNGYKAIITYDKTTDQYLNINKTFDPDIIFFSRPYSYAVHKYYRIENFKDKLTCYVNYAFNTSSFDSIIYDLFFTNILWKFFLETPYHKEYYKSLSRNKGANSIVTGYPGVEKIKFQSRENGSWKIIDPNIKRIIWAPHNSVLPHSYLSYSNFLKYHQLMLDLAEKYLNKAQFSFKPHPVLKLRLYEHKDWGIKRTNNYYKKWEEGINTQFDDMDYFRLFNSCDAIIHDCGSFVAEFLYTGKPALFTMKNHIEKEFNEFGEKALEQYYKAYNEHEVEAFIEMIINNEDNMKAQRHNFYNEYLKYPEGQSPSKIIFEYIREQIK